MTKHTIYIAVTALTVLTGCATPPAPPAPTQAEMVDSIVATYAAKAAEALRQMSDNTGRSRVVTPGQAPENAGARIAPGGSIASRVGSIPVAPGSQSTGPAVVQSRVEGIPSAMQVPEGLERPMTIAWTGDLESLIFIVGKETGWKVNAPTGLRVAPVIIAINAKDKPAFEVLRDVGAIAGEAADVVVSVANKTLTVAYPTR